MAQAEPTAHTARPQDFPRSLAVKVSDTDRQMWRRWPRLITRLAFHLGLDEEPWKAAAVIRLATLGPLSGINRTRIGRARFTPEQARQMIATAIVYRHTHRCHLVQRREWSEKNRFKADEATRRLVSGAHLGVVLRGRGPVNGLGTRWASPPRVAHLLSRWTVKGLEAWASACWPAHELDTPFCFFEVER